MVKGEDKQHFEIIVLGDGSGATLARNLAQFGKKVALIGHGNPGGTCLNRGCIPSKKLIVPTFKIYSALKTLKTKSHSKEVEKLHVKDFINFKTLRAEVQKEVHTDSQDSKKNMENGDTKNLTYFSSHATFIDDTTLQLESGEILSFDKIIIATGSNPRFPKEIKGIENITYDTSTEALFTQDEFDNYSILGGGVISCELGALYAICGISVTILSIGNILMPVDDMIKPHAEEYLKNLGITIIKGIHIDEISQNEDIISISYSQEKLQQTHTTNRLMIALGISPNTSNLGLEHTSIPLNERGFIAADDNFKINEHVFAIGDCSGKSQLRHGASHESREVFKQLIMNSKEALSQKYMPYGIYLGESEIGGCGKTIYQLKKEGRSFKTYIKKFEDTVYGKAKRSKGIVVIHYDEHTLEILGSHVFGPDATNLNQIVVPYIESGKTLFDLANTICPHPSLAEGLFTIGIRDVVYTYWKENN